MLTVLLLSLTVAAEPQVKEPPAQLELFAAEDWYKGQKGKEEDFVGVLERVQGDVGIGRFNPYRLKFGKDVREVYAGGKPDLLAPHVGKKVKLIGKAVDLEVDGRPHREIWPARLEVSAPEQEAARLDELRRRAEHLRTGIASAEREAVIAEALAIEVAKTDIKRAQDLRNESSKQRALALSLREQLEATLEQLRAPTREAARIDELRRRAQRILAEITTAERQAATAEYLAIEVAKGGDIKKAQDLRTESAKQRGLAQSLRQQLEAIREQIRTLEKEQAPARADILADRKLYKMEPVQEKTLVGVLRKGEKGGYYLELTDGKAVGREDLVLYGDVVGDPLEPYVGKRVRLIGKQVVGAVGMRKFQHTLPGRLEVLPEEKEKPPNEETVRRAQELEDRLAKVEAQLETLRRGEIELRRQLTEAIGADERRRLEAELARTIAESQQYLLLKARLRRELLELQQPQPQPSGTEKQREQGRND